MTPSWHTAFPQKRRKPMPEQDSEKVTLTDADLDTLHNAGLNLRAYPAGTIGRAHMEGIQRAIEQVIASHFSSEQTGLRRLGRGSMMAATSAQSARTN